MTKSAIFISHSFDGAENNYFFFGLIHLEYPRCIKWFGSGFGNESYQFIEHPTIKQFNKLSLWFEKIELYLMKHRTKDFPFIEYKL